MARGPALQRASYGLLQHLGASAKDALRARVDVGARDGRAGHVTGGAMNLYGKVHDPAEHLAGPVLGLAGLDDVEPVTQPGEATIDERLRNRDLRVSLRQSEPNRLSLQ